jgi:O-acetyl-ADP-ribose deacetylase (regulator of RNase III)
VTLQEVDGDLLRIARKGEAIGHGCNCDGVMGGLAAHVEAHWPQLAQVYRAACRAGTFTLAAVLPWLDDSTGVWIYNLATQQHPGADARLEAIDASVRAAIVHAREHEVARIYLPRIGAGIGGLPWEDVRATLESVAATNAGVELVVVRLPPER